MINVSFEDHEVEFMGLVRRKLQGAVTQAADRLADDYRDELTKTKAPPHSGKGEIPHAYFGWKPGGYGPTNSTLINNIGQTDYLANYITYETTNIYGTITAYIGFLPSHMPDGQNYLLGHDRAKRPWIVPIFDAYIEFASIAAVKGFAETT